MTIPTSFNLISYFPALAILGLLATFWNQSKNFVIKIFRIFWKVRTIESDFYEKFYITLLGQSKVFNFDDYNLLQISMFSKKEKIFLPALFKAHTTEIFFYKGWIPIFLFGAPDGRLKIEYLKYTFNFEKFLTEITKVIHSRRIQELNKAKNNSSTPFFIQEVRGDSVKEKMISPSSGESGSNNNSKGNEASPSKEQYYTNPPSVSFRHNLQKMIGLKNDDFFWYMQTDAVRNKYEFTEQGKYLLEQVKKWLKSEKWCQERNIPHKRGCLLYGQSGSGKSALVLEIAETVNIPIYYFDVSDMTNEEFSKKLNSLTSSPAIILFEDFDAQFNKRESSSKSSQYQNLTFDYFINKLSGIKSIQNKFIFITTNHIEKMDDALLRAGRLDYKIEYRSLNKQEKKNMTKRILDFDEEESENFVNEGLNDTTAEFENRCILKALDLYWNKND